MVTMSGSQNDDASIRKCIIRDEVLTSVNDSRAHVIPSALGGRLKPLGVLSRAANTLLGETVDQLLVASFNPLMAQLNGSRDRGTNQPIKIQDATGRWYHVEFGEAVQLARPAYSVTEEPDRTVIRIQARTTKEMRILLGRVESRVSGFDIDAAMAHAEVVRSWPPDDGMLRSQLEVGPGRTFPALYVAASVFAASKGLKCHSDLRAYVKAFDSDLPVLPPDTFNFYSVEPWAVAPGEVTHKVVLVGDPSRSRALVFFELFNIIEVAVSLPFEGPELRIETYGVDILNGTEVPVHVDVPAILGRQWVSSHDLGPGLLKLIEDRVGRVIGIAQQRAADAAVRRDVAEFDAQLRGDGPVTADSLLNALSVPAEFLELEFQRPNMPPKRAKWMAGEFAGMVAKMGAILSADERKVFDATSRTLVERIAGAADALK